ncbi:MAG: hypothetical protein M1826_004747 [Phylliscum demangeonii]|nr:MAG: hypothetical protein M1826_004747 [Phylliscum demangeonii]
MKRARAWMVVVGALMAVAAARGRCVSLPDEARRDVDDLDVRPDSVPWKARSTVAAAAAAAAAAGRSAIDEPGRQRESISGPRKDDGRAADRGPRPPPLHGDIGPEGGNRRLSGVPTMQEMEMVLSKDEYDAYVADWERGKASRRMDHAISRGHVMTAEEHAQQAADHQSGTDAQRQQRRVARILIQSRRARPETVETYQSRARVDTASRRARRQKTAAEYRTLKALVAQGEANAAQTEQYQTIKKARTAENQKARARKRKAVEEANAGMSKLKRLINTDRATKAQQKKYSQLEDFVNGKGACRKAQNERCRDNRKKREKEASDAPEASDQDNGHPLPITAHPLLHQFESSLRKPFRGLRQSEMRTFTWLHTIRRLAPEATPRGPVLALPE